MERGLEEGSVCSAQWRELGNWPGLGESQVPAAWTEPSLGHLLRDFCSLALSERDPGVYWLHAHWPFMPSPLCNSVKLLRALMLRLTWACPSPNSPSSAASHPLLLPTSPVSSFFLSYADQRVIFSHTLHPFCYICFLLTLPFLVCPPLTPLVRPLVPPVWTLGDTVWTLRMF